MKKRNNSNYTWQVVLAGILMLTACTKDPAPVPAFNNPPFTTGFYLLNEGNMNMNQASLDFYDLAKDTFYRDVYTRVNPGVTLGLGDVGNDLGIYGSRLYIVVNASNKIEVLDSHTAKKIAQINIPNCRYICFANGKAYISSYQGKIGDPASAAGFVAEIDTTSFAITRQVSVGRQPEEMAVVNNKLYVANSGGYDPANYEHTVSVVDLSSFTEIHRIETGINLQHLKADKYGDIYVTSRGDYYNVPSKLYVISTQNDQVKKIFDTGASNLWIDDDTAYVYSTEFSYQTGENTISYKKINVKDETIAAQPFITDGTEKSIALPYGIAVNPDSKDVYVTDAKDYVSPGTLYCFDKTGKKKWALTAGDIPAHIAFLK